MFGQNSASTRQEEHTADLERIRQGHRDWSDRIQRAEQERQDRDRLRSEAIQAEQHRVSLMTQAAQREWATRRNELRAAVIELEGQLSVAEGRMASADLDDAVRAAGEAVVYKARLEQAQNAYANHMRQQP